VPAGKIRGRYLALFLAERLGLPETPPRTGTEDVSVEPEPCMGERKSTLRGQESPGRPRPTAAAAGLAKALKGASETFKDQ
jgi:hypothetical protein